MLLIQCNNNNGNNNNNNNNKFSVIKCYKRKLAGNTKTRGAW